MGIYVNRAVVTDVAGSQAGRAVTPDAPSGSVEMLVVAAPGTRINEFEIIAPVSGPGRGAAYLARDTRRGRCVTLEFLPDRASEVSGTRVADVADGSVAASRAELVAGLNGGSDGDDGARGVARGVSTSGLDRGEFGECQGISFRVIAAPERVDRDIALAGAIASADLARARAGGHASGPDEVCPYVGLRPYRRRDAARFLGRAAAARAAAERLARVNAVTIIDAPGVGKTSFVAAGLIPALTGADDAWIRVTVRPGRLPIAGLIEALRSAMPPGSLPDASTDAALSRLFGRAIDDPAQLADIVPDAARRVGRRALIWIDALEDVYRGDVPARQRAAFIAWLSALLESPAASVRVVVSARSSLWAHVQRDPTLMATLVRALFPLPPLDAGAMREALRRPMVRAGYRFETDAIVDDAIESVADAPGSLALLQLVGALLWRIRDPSSRVIPERGYRRVAGIVHAILSHAEVVSGQLQTHTLELAHAIAASASALGASAAGDDDICDHRMARLIALISAPALNGALGGALGGAVSGPLDGVFDSRFKGARRANRSPQPIYSSGGPTR